MRTFNIYTALLVCVVAFGGLVQCGGAKSKSAGIEISVLPNKPIVITADSINGSTNKVLKWPWFAFRVSITNNTDEPFEIVAIQAEVTGVGPNGQSTILTVAGDPSNWNYANDTVDCRYTTFGTWAVNESKEISLTANMMGCRNGPAQFVFDNMIKGMNDNYRYRVKFKPIGYFVNPQNLSEPTDRLEKFKYFQTQ